MHVALAVSAVLWASSVHSPGPDPRTIDSPMDLHLAMEPADLGSPTLVLDSRLLRAGEGDPAGEGGTASVDGARGARLRWWGRTLRWTTALALVGTSTLGTLAAINQPTAFGDGRCVTGRPILGNYGCDRGLSTLHGTAGVLSALAYTANGVLNLAAPESRGTVAPAARPWHRALGYVHLGGIVVQPILGLVSAFPQVIGKDRTAPTDRFPKNLRTAHVFIGYATTAAFLGTLALER